MKIDYTAIGRNIKFYRSKKGLKQGQLAELCDVTSQHISHIECDKTKVSLQVLFTIAQALDTDIYTLAGIESPLAKLDDDFSEVLKAASPEQRRQCLEICRAAVQYCPKARE